MKEVAPVFNVSGYGVNGEGVTNVTAEIQAVFDAVPTIGGTVYFPNGTYMIDAITGIKPKSNTTIILSPGATLKAITNSATNYNILLIQNVSNFHVYGGGTILGERTTHIGTTGEWGMGISILGSNNITIEM